MPDLTGIEAKKERLEWLVDKWFSLRETGLHWRELANYLETEINELLKEMGGG